jgi:hypothetical protein
MMHDVFAVRQVNTVVKKRQKYKKCCWQFVKKRSSVTYTDVSDW